MGASCRGMVAGNDTAVLIQESICLRKLYLAARVSRKDLNGCLIRFEIFDPHCPDSVFYCQSAVIQLCWIVLKDASGCAGHLPLLHIYLISLLLSHSENATSLKSGELPFS